MSSFLRANGLLWLLLLTNSKIFGAACCAGGGGRSFLSLEDLQSYEIGISTSQRHVTGAHQRAGKSIDSPGDETFTLSAGASARIFFDIEAFAVVPTVLRKMDFAGTSASKTNLGDISVGGRIPLLRPLPSDAPPALTLLLGMKFPTGNVLEIQNGEATPGTGNGIWEPSLGLEIKKSLSLWTLATTASYTLRLPKDQYGHRSKDGNRLELAATLSYPVSSRFSLMAGIGAYWDGENQLDGAVQSGTNAKSSYSIFSATYYLNRFWGLTAQLEHSLPWDGFGRNQAIARTLTLSTTYGFF